MNCLPNRFNLLAVCLLASAAGYAQPEPATLPPLPPTPPERIVAAYASTPSPVDPLAAQEGTQERTELHRRLIKSYAVTPSDVLSIDNHFGDVTVSHWDRSEMRVEVVITSSSENAERARRALEAVTINEDHKDNAHGFKTHIAEAFSGGWKKGDRTNFLRVDYRIAMPRANGLTIRNKFGNVNIPDFSAPLAVESQFGNIYGAAMTNPATTINASFGNVSIRDVQNGKVKMEFGDLDISSGNVLTIVQNYGKLRIGETNRVDVNMSYADAIIGAIRQSGKLNMNYTKQFRLEQLPASADQLEVNAKFSSVALPVQTQTHCDFDITVTNGGFTYPTLPNLHLISQPGSAQAAPRAGKRQQYVGRVGDGDGPRIRVVSVFGDVKFK